MKNNYIEEIIEMGKWIIQKNMTWGTSGNISARGDDGKFYITASGTSIGNLSESDIILCDIDGKTQNEKGKPSKEVNMHLQVYQKRPDINAVIHASPFYSTLCACSNIRMQTNLFIESMYYLSDIAYVPYCHAGSMELADEVAKVCANANIIFMSNHGVTVYDTNFKEAKNALEILENACKMNVLANIGKFGLIEVDNETVNKFLNGSYYKPRRVYHEK